MAYIIIIFDLHILNNTPSRTIKPKFLKMIKILLLIVFSFIGFAVSAREINVAKTGNDSNKGTKESPLLTIQAAAYIAQPGDVIMVHEGVYREG